MTLNDRRALVDLLPQFLTRALRGWDRLATLLESTGMERPAFFLLRALVQERDAGTSITQDAMYADLYNPYSTIRPTLDALSALVAGEYIVQAGDQYIVTPEGRALFAHIEAAKEGYLAPLAPIAVPDLVRLAGALEEIAQRLRDAPEPERKAHQARAWRVMPPANAAPMVRVYGAVYALWMARDDSHNAAWRAAGFDGPTFDLLSRVWSGESTTIPTLTDAVRDFQRPNDVSRGVAALAATGYLAQADEMLTLTTHGKATRDRIEAETDRVYFAPWPPLIPEESAWLRATLDAVVAGLPS